MSDEKTPGGDTPTDDATSQPSQDETKARMDDIRSRMQKMRGENETISSENRPARPKAGKSKKKKGFSETLWFMQVEDPDHMVVDSNTDIEQSDLQEKYTKKQTLEINVRKQFSLNVDLDDFDE